MPPSTKVCPYCGQCKRFFHLRALVPPTQAVEIQREKKDVKIIQMGPPGLINHSFTNTITVTDNVMGERNRKI